MSAGCQVCGREEETAAGLPSHGDEQTDPDTAGVHSSSDQRDPAVSAAFLSVSVHRHVRYGISISVWLCEWERDAERGAELPLCLWKMWCILFGWQNPQKIAVILPLKHLNWYVPNRKSLLIFRQNYKINPWQSIFIDNSDPTGCQSQWVYQSKSSHKIWTRGINCTNMSAFYTHAHLNIGRICSHTCICSQTSARVHDAVSAHLSQATSENEMFHSLPVKNQFSLTVSVWPDWNAISSLQTSESTASWLQWICARACF